VAYAHWVFLQTFHIFSLFSSGCAFLSFGWFAFIGFNYSAPVKIRPSLQGRAAT
jgi:hypothetical protein